jgi:hypothetical protein
LPHLGDRERAVDSALKQMTRMRWSEQPIRSRVRVDGAEHLEVTARERTDRGRATAVSGTENFDLRARGGVEGARRRPRSR